jgi:hypothetical protein
MYRLSDNLKTTSRANKSLKNHIHIHYPVVECSSITTVSFLNKSSSIMYPVVFRLRRSSIDSSVTLSSTLFR